MIRRFRLKQTGGNLPNIGRVVGKAQSWRNIKAFGRNLRLDRSLEKKDSDGDMCRFSEEFSFLILAAQVPKV